MPGKNINYFLLDNTSNGRIKCTLANWTGVAYKIPRVKLVDCKNIEYLKQSGVYFLFSRGENDKPLVYVGQAGSRKNGEGVLNRLKEHHANPKPGLEDWYEAIAFTTSNNINAPTNSRQVTADFSPHYCVDVVCRATARPHSIALSCDENPRCPFVKTLLNH
jgi:hypothetical protein